MIKQQLERLIKDMCNLWPSLGYTVIIFREADKHLNLSNYNFRTNDGVGRILMVDATSDTINDYFDLIWDTINNKSHGERCED